VCVTSREHPERSRNARRLEENDVAVFLDEEQVSSDSVRLSVEYSKTLNKERLSLYKRAAKESDPLRVLEGIIRDAL